MTTTPPTANLSKLDNVFLVILKNLFSLDNDKLAYFDHLLEKVNIINPATLVNVFGEEWNHWYYESWY